MVMKRIGSLSIFFLSLSAKTDYELIINKKKIYINEKIPFVLKFTTDEKNVSLVSIQDPEVDGIKIIEVSKPVILNNGVEISGSLYATTTGDIEIPPLQLKYRVGKTTANDDNQLFSFLFSRAYETKTIFTKPTSLHVLALPVKPKEIVNEDIYPGKFTKFKAEILPNKITTASAATYKLILEGDGNWDKIDKINLQLPEGLKYYNSKVSFDGQKKVFEYIIQPIESGEFEIPQQNFFFFDTSTNNYKKLSSNTVKITVEKVETKVEIKKEIKIEPVVAQVRNVVFEPEKYFPLDILFFLLFIPVLAKLLAILLILFLKRTKRRRIIMRAKRQLKLSYKENRVDQFYEIIRQTLANYFELPVNQITDEEIINNLEKFCADKNITKNFQELSDKLIVATKFSLSKINFDSGHDLYSKSLNFLGQLQKGKCRGYLFVLLHLFVFDSAGQAAQLIKLRWAQQNVSSNKLLEIEDQIKDIKEKNGAKYINRFDNILGKIFINFNYMPLLIWQIILIICWWILILFGSLLNKRSRILITLLLILCACATFIILHMRLQKIGIIKVNNPKIFVAPNVQILKEPIAKVNWLDDVEIIKRKDNWYYIRVQNDTGWILKDDLEIL